MVTDTSSNTTQSIHVYLAGDSTMQSYTPRQAPQGGWGQHIGRYFSPEVQFHNHAIGGRSSRSFVNEGRLTEILERIRPGDYLFVQMGHNDSTPQRPLRFTEPFTGFVRYMRQYVEGARSKGAVPVLITPMGRLHECDGGYIDDFSDYCAAVRRLAAEMHTPLIDLMRKSLDFYTRIGREEAYSLFMVSANGTDHTHFTHKGADAIAWLVAGEVRKLGLDISQYVRAGEKPLGAPADTRPEQPFCRRFSFGVTHPTAGVVPVAPGTLFSARQSYGFVTDAVRAGDPALRLPAVTNGFVPETRLSLPVSPAEAGAWEPGIRAEAPGLPLYFRVRVPESGTYRVEMTIGDEPGRAATVFSERRRFVYHGVPTQHTGGRETVAFVASVCDVIPRGQETLADSGNAVPRAPSHDEAVDITVVGCRPTVYTLRVERVETVPTIFLAGDSTVTDQVGDTPYRPTANYCGWGQSLPLFLTDGVCVSNHAHSGLTTATFREHGHWDIVRRMIRPGDFFLMQFGHNDQKLPELDAFGGYAANLRRYVTEVRELGAMPVIVTPVSRSRWNGPGGAFQDLLADNAEACRQVGIEMSVWVLDLHGKSVEFIRRLGPRAAQSYFHEGDQTHFNDRGGFEMAGFVAECIRQTDAAGLARFLKEAPAENPFAADESAAERTELHGQSEADPATLA